MALQNDRGGGGGADSGRVLSDGVVKGRRRGGELRENHQ